MFLQQWNEILPCCWFSFPLSAASLFPLHPLSWGERSNFLKNIIMWVDSFNRIMLENCKASQNFNYKNMVEKSFFWHSKPLFVDFAGFCVVISGDSSVLLAAFLLCGLSFDLEKKWIKRCLKIRLKKNMHNRSIMLLNVQITNT